MNNGINSVSITDADAFMEEFNARNKKGEAEYRKMLRQLCPSKEMRKRARRISNGKYPCYKCAYRDKETGKCRNPHTELYNIFIDTDDCYEGVLRYMAAEAEKAREAGIEAEMEAKDTLIAEMSKALESAVNIAIDNMRITRIFARWIVMMADGNWKMPLAAVKTVRETLDWLNEVLPDETAEAYGE